MINLAGEQLDLTIKFAVVFFILAFSSYIYDILNK